MLVPPFQKHFVGIATVEIAACTPYFQGEVRTPSTPHDAPLQGVADRTDHGLRHSARRMCAL